MEADDEDFYQRWIRSLFIGHQWAHQLTLFKRAINVAKIISGYPEHSAFRERVMIPFEAARDNSERYQFEEIWLSLRILAAPDSRYETGLLLGQPATVFPMHLRMQMGLFLAETEAVFQLEEALAAPPSLPPISSFASAAAEPDAPIE